MTFNPILDALLMVVLTLALTVVFTGAVVRGKFG